MTKKKSKLYGLSARHTRKHAKDFVDYDYTDKLSEDEKAWLNKFSKEYYQSNFSKTDAIHPSDQRKDIYNRDNAARRDVWNNNWRVPVDATEYMTDEDED